MNVSVRPESHVQGFANGNAEIVQRMHAQLKAVAQMVGVWSFVPSIFSRGHRLYRLLSRLCASAVGLGWLASIPIALLPACAIADKRIALAAQVDLNALQGGWYIVATIPNWFERGMVAPCDVYSLRADGDVREDFYVQSGGFAAKRRHFTVKDHVLPGTNNASWRVQIFWPISLPFLVLYTDPAYRFVLFGENDHSLGWVYSRTPTIDDTDYRALLDRFASLGYDPTRFRKVVQFPAQVGMPGFWSDGISGGKQAVGSRGDVMRFRNPSGCR